LRGSDRSGGERGGMSHNRGGSGGVIALCIHQSGNDWSNLTKDLGNLAGRLRKDSDCMTLLTSAGSTSNTVFGMLANPSPYFAIADYLQGPSGDNLAGVTDAFPDQPHVVLNGLDYSNSNSNSNQRMNFLTILHEMAHYTGVFGPENVPGNPTSKANDQTIMDNCNKTLLGIRIPRSNSRFLDF
jgi:hypothetical protein